MSSEQFKLRRHGLLGAGPLRARLQESSVHRGLIAGVVQLAGVT
jgi:hypothetical protein